MPYIDSVDGTRLFYKDLGSGPAVLLLHSWSLSSDMWEYQIQALIGAGYRCIAPDRRGHGRSDVSAGGYDLDLLADDVATLVERLDLTGVSIVAHSMGACEAVRAIARHGAERVARVALLGTMTPYLVGTVGPAFVDALVEDLRADRPRWFHESAPGYFATTGSGSWVSQALVDDGVSTILRTPLEVQVECLRTFAGTDLTADVAALEPPVLLLHGEHDASAPIDITGRATAALLPHARLVTYARAGHGIYVTDKDAVTKELLAFLDGA